MKIIVTGTENQLNEFHKKPLPQGAELLTFKDIQSLPALPAAYVLFDLAFEPDTNRLEILTSFEKPVIINSVTHTLKALGLPENFIRINAWPGFLERTIVEVAGGYATQKQLMPAIFELLQWPYQLVPDTPGMNSARVIAMIVNEAYFALGEGVSTKEEIDIAMKLGTNYPYGPFEWSKKIGLINIYKLLHKLQTYNTRYNIAPLLEKEATQL
jgi:3-hydroxybutyryl-CoA dehydrogenase